MIFRDQYKLVYDDLILNKVVELKINNCLELMIICIFHNILMQKNQNKSISYSVQTIIFQSK